MKGRMTRWIVAALLCTSGAKVLAYGPSWTPMYKGVDHAVLETEPLVNALRIDLRDPDIELYTTPGNGAGAYDTDVQKTTDFLTANNCQIAINGGNALIYGSQGDLLGLGVSEGVLVSGGSTNFEEIVFTSDNVADIDYSGGGTVSSNTWTALAGESILYKGALFSSSTNEHPRTAVGLSLDKRYLYLLTIDGRQTYPGIGYYEGATPPEAALWLVQAGAFHGLNFDGGGSTTMARSDGAGGATLLNRPIDGGVLDQVRAVASSLGVRAKALAPDIVFGDSSFEDDETTTGVDISASTITAWETTYTGDTPDIRQQGYYAPAAAHSGEQVCYLGGAAIYQNFTNTYVEGTTYILTYYAYYNHATSSGTTYAYFTDADGSGNYGGVTKSGAIHTKVMAGSWQRCTVEYTATAADVGDNIGFGLYGSTYVYVDDVVFGAATEPANEIVDPAFEKTYLPSQGSRSYDYISTLNASHAYPWGSSGGNFIVDTSNSLFPDSALGSVHPDNAHNGVDYVDLNNNTIYQALPGHYEEGKTYTLTWWATAGSNQVMYVYFTDGDGENGYKGASNEWYFAGANSGTYVVLPNDDKTWVQYSSVPFIARASHAGKRIGIHMFGRSQTFIDDVAVTVTPRTTLEDTGFELDLPNGDPGRGYDYVGALYEGDDSPWGSGSSAYIMDLAYTNTAGSPVAAHGGDQAAKLYQKSIFQALNSTYEEGVEYTMSVWATTASTNEQALYLAFTDGDYANGALSASNYNLVASSSSIVVPNSGGATWNEYTFSHTATAADAGKRIGVKVYGRTETWCDDVTLTFATPDPEIIGFTKVSGDVYEIELTCAPSAKASTQPLKRANLVTGSWAATPHAATSAGPFTTTNNLNVSGTAGSGNPVIYVESTDDEAFYGLGQP